MLPTIATIASRYAAGTVFTRFITASSPEQAPGRWSAYFKQAGLLRFFRSSLTEYLLERRVRTIVVSGAETDVCVLSTVLNAVDMGFHVVLIEDASCSSSDAGHDALMTTMYRMRFTEQIDLISAERLLDVWRPDHGP